MPYDSYKVTQNLGDSSKCACKGGCSNSSGNGGWIFITVGLNLVPVCTTHYCTSCDEAMDVFGDYALCCKKSGMIERHTLVVQFFCQPATAARLLMDVEVRAADNLRPALLSRSSSSKHFYLSPFGSFQIGCRRPQQQLKHTMPSAKQRTYHYLLFD